MWAMKRNGRGVVGAAGMLVAAAVLVGASPDATAQQAPPVVVGAGQLRLHLIGTGGTVTWEVNGAVVETQTISSSRCRVSTSGAELLTFTPSTGDVGLVSNGLGVRTKNNCNTAEGRLSVGESLQVALGSALPLDTRVTTAALDIEGKFNASLDYTLGDDPTDYDPISLANASDNGPDAGPGDNLRVTITPALFRSITLFPTSGELSLEGGGDYAATTGPNDTILTLGTVFDQGVDCGESVVVIGAPGEAASEGKFRTRAERPADTLAAAVPEDPGDARHPVRQPGRAVRGHPSWPRRAFARLRAVCETIKGPVDRGCCSPSAAHAARSLRTAIRRDKTTMRMTKRCSPRRAPFAGGPAR